MTTTVAVLGLGQMGHAMASRLRAQGLQLRVWNRSRDKASDLDAVVCDTPAEAARGADFVLSSLANDDAVRTVALDPALLDALGDGGVHVGTSTTSRALTLELQQAHEARGRAWLSAPVLGRPDAILAGKLFILAGGPAAAIERCRPLFAALGQRTIDFADAAQANVAKIVANFMLGGMIELLGEALTLGERGGIAPAATAKLLTETIFGCPAVVNYSKLVVEKRFEPAGFAMPLGLKDVELALGLGKELRVPLPVGNVVRDSLLTALARGLESLDWSALTTSSRARAGLDS